MIRPAHLLEHVIRPVLKELELWSVEAENLILGTACVESDCGFSLVQVGGGPALGIYQMEPASHNDIYANYLAFRLPLMSKVMGFCGKDPRENESLELIGNLNYATAMTRIHYLRDPEPIPRTLEGQAKYWKRVYNTHLGKGTPAGYLAKWEQFVGRAV